MSNKIYTQTISEVISQLQVTAAEKDTAKQHDQPGRPGCPDCQGSGYMKLDLPIHHPNFGQIHICDCRASEITKSIMADIYTLNDIKTLSKLTFDNFETDDRPGQNILTTLARAKRISADFAQEPEGWILLAGSFGCGKTHLAAAIANKAAANAIPTLFITVPDMLDKLRATIQDKDVTMDQRFEQMKAIKLLVLDDLGVENTTDWSKEKLFQIINHRYIRMQPTVITTNLGTTEMNNLYPRIVSRISDTQLVTKIAITAPDYRRKPAP